MKGERERERKKSKRLYRHVSVRALSLSSAKKLEEFNRIFRCSGLFSSSPIVTDFINIATIRDKTDQTSETIPKRVYA